MLTPSIMKSLLIILPSRGRPDRIQECLDSYIMTTSGEFSEISVQLDHNDPKIDEYKKVLKKYEGRVSYDICRRPSDNPKVYCITRIINRKFYTDNNRDYYCVINDDMVFETVDWDKKLAIEWAISTCREPNMLAKHGEWKGNTPIAGFPIISVIDGRICREIGWLQMPELDGCCGDNCWFLIGLQAKNLLYNPDVVFYHNHQSFGKSEMDDTYSPVYGDNNAGAMEDYRRHCDWARYRMNKVIKSIRQLIEKNIGNKQEELCTALQ